MTIPVWVFLVAFAFFTLVAVALSVPPRLTMGGRLFYAVTGLAGILTGAFWLLWNAALCGYGRLHPPAVPDITLAEAFERMFAPHHYPVSSILGCTTCVVGIGFLLYGVFGKPHRESQLEGEAAGATEPDMG
jgi:hypothetical protein